MVEMERKYFTTDSLAGFSGLGTSEESQSYHIALLLTEIRESRRDQAPNYQETKSGSGLLTTSSENGWLNFQLV